MSDADHLADQDDVDAQLAAMLDALDEKSKVCHFRSMARIADEIRRLAKAEHRLFPYLRATFFQMNFGMSRLLPEVERDLGMEMIALLEHDDRARQFQPDLAEDDYDNYKYWYTTCSYDHFALGVGQSQGFNSTGMHACITEGLQVCRRTGKLQCVSCFREYALDVYRASDDIPMALHFAQLLMTNSPSDDDDRRWTGASNMARLAMLQGQASAALDFAKKAWELRGSHHSPFDAELESIVLCRTAIAFAGSSSADSSWFDADDKDSAKLLPRGEYERLDLQRDQADAFIAGCEGDYPKAISMLEDWDQKLRRQKCLSDWFEHRLRLIATLRYAGQDARIAGLAKQLRTEAEKVRDWLTQRRLERLLDPSANPTLLATVADPTSGPFARSTPKGEGSADVTEAIKASDERRPPVNSDVADSSRPTATAVPNDLSSPSKGIETPVNDADVSPDIQVFRDSIMARLNTEWEKEEWNTSPLLTEILSIAPSSIESPGDARELIRLLRFVCNSPDEITTAWRWATQTAERFSGHHFITTQLATLGSIYLHILDQQGEELSIPLLSRESIEKMFQASMDAEPAEPIHFTNAGWHYQNSENLPEAERCFARAFRLDRKASFAVLGLAEIYKQTDRPRDALAALDLALREGCDDPKVAWEATLVSSHLEQYAAVLTYLDRLELLSPSVPWSRHYRAVALLVLERPAEAIEAIEEEARLTPEAEYAHQVMRSAALGAIALDDKFDAALEKVIEAPLTSVDCLTITGLAKLHRLLWLAVAKLPPNHIGRRRYEQLLIEGYLAPDELFRERRTRRGGEPTLVNFYRCTVIQPLDGTWQNALGCRNGEESWLGYFGMWGVLANSEEEATDYLMKLHNGFVATEPSVVDVELAGEDYRDFPGIAWQGVREEATPNDENEDELDLEIDLDDLDLDDLDLDELDELGDELDEMDLSGEEMEGEFDDGLNELFPDEDDDENLHDGEDGGNPDFGGPHGNRPRGPRGEPF